MLQQIENFASLFFATLTGIFFLLGIYFGFKYYPSNKERVRYTLLGIVSLGLSVFIFSIELIGFAWDTLVFIVCLMAILTFFLMFDDLIRKGTATFLKKRGARLFINKNASIQNSGNDDNKKP